MTKVITGMRLSALRAAVVTISAVAVLAATVPLRAEVIIPLTGRFTGAGDTFSGTFSQLGAFTGTVDLATGAAVWTSADGDTVTAQTVIFMISAEPIGGTVYPYHQTIQITGGSGRFAGVTGEVNVTGTIDINTLVYDGLVSGTMAMTRMQPVQ